MRARLLTITALVPVLALGATAAPATGDTGATASERPAAAPAADHPRTLAAVARDADQPVGFGRVQAPRVPVAATTGVGVTVVDELPSMVDREERANFNVTYKGFSKKAKRAFQRAVDMWAKRLKSPVPITVKARWKRLPGPALGNAGPSFYWHNFRHAPRRNTLYVDAVANMRAGKQLSRKPDIVATFDKSFGKWHFGKGRTPANRIDFQSVVSHELGHGLGFLGLGRINGNNKGTLRIRNKLSAWDVFTENTSGTKLRTFADPSKRLRRAIKSGHVFLDSPKLDKRARLYVPKTFDPGSSYNHLGEKRYKAGNINSLMTPQIGPGETIRIPGTIGMAIMRTIGWR